MKRIVLIALIVSGAYSSNVFPVIKNITKLTKQVLKLYTYSKSAVKCKQNAHILKRNAYWRLLHDNFLEGSQPGIKAWNWIDEFKKMTMQEKEMMIKYIICYRKKHGDAFSVPLGKGIYYNLAPVYDEYLKIIRREKNRITKE